MRTTDCHQDAGAYALGVLGAADAFRFEEHLAGCAACGVRVRQFGGVRSRLAAFVELLPAGVAPVTASGPGMPDRLVAAVASGRRTSRRRRVALAAAA
ncbi:zf-HC2 domain-containing protein, partial [Streptomyces sp. NPDC005899]|uniref:anti-sigma factor family protein n=1 Tax=Streptomyces sp. NPDC005899 TaxID=3155716 RepID=UPI0033EC48EF